MPAAELAPVEAVGVLVAGDLDELALAEAQLLVAGVGVGAHGGRVVVEERHEDAGVLVPLAAAAGAPPAAPLASAVRVLAPVLAAVSPVALVAVAHVPRVPGVPVGVRVPDVGVPSVPRVSGVAAVPVVLVAGVSHVSGVSGVADHGPVVVGRGWGPPALQVGPRGRIAGVEPPAPALAQLIILLKGWVTFTG